MRLFAEDPRSSFNRPFNRSSATVFTRSEQDHFVVRFAEVMHPRQARALNRSE